MRILILGGDGMLGHQLFKRLRMGHDARVTLKREIGAYKGYGIFSPKNAYANVNVRETDRLLEVVSDFHPEAVINAVGVVKQRSSSNEFLSSLEINGLLPHRLSTLCGAINARLLHMSTDCVFSGRKGGYTESDPSDAEDLYGKTKYLGEVTGSHCITFRTSIIGRELSRKKSLLEWFLAQKGHVEGFKNAIFSGFTTIELSNIVEKILVDFPNASGIYHVSSDPITKFDLLTLIKKTLGLSVEIDANEEFRCDRSLDSTRFRREFNYTPPTWESMINELAKEDI